MARWWLVVGCAIAAATAFWAATRERPALDSASGSSVARGEAEPQSAPRPILRGSGAPDPDSDVWLTVRVRESPGDRPVPELTVFVVLRRQAEPGHELYLIRQTDARGTIRVGPLATREIEVGLGSDLHRPLDAWLTPIPRSPTEIEVEATLEKGRSIAGRIVLPADIPPEHVIPLEHVRVGLDRSHLRHDSIEVDGAGHFEAHGLADGPVEVLAIAAHDGRSWFGRADAQAGDRSIEIKLSEARAGDIAMVRVRLVEVSGDPADAFVGFERFASDASGWESPRLVRGDGVFLYDYRPDTELYFHVLPILSGSLGETLAGPVLGTDVVIRLLRQRRIKGSTVDVGGDPVAGVEVVAASEHPSSARLAARARPPVITDDLGRFAIDGLGPHAYRVTLRPPTRFVVPDVQVVAAGRRDLRIVLAAGADVKITVVDESGKAVEGVAVRLHPAEGANRLLREATTDATGVGILEGIDAAARYRLVLEPPEGRTDLLPVHADSWSPLDAAFVLPVGHTISGTLRDRSGNPIGGTYVALHGIGMPYGGAIPRRNPDGSETWVHLGARTGLDGSFVVERLRPGRYEVRPYGRSRGAVTVASGSSGVELIVSEAMDQRVRFMGWRTEDRGAWALVRRENQRGCTANRIGADGRLTIREADSAAEYELWVGGLAGGRYAWQRGFVPTGEEVEVPIQQGGTIRVRLVLPEGVAIAEWAVLTGGPLQSFDASEGILGSFLIERNDEARSFDVHGVPAGEWLISVFAEEGDRAFAAEVWASPGDDVRAQLVPEE